MARQVTTVGVRSGWGHSLDHASAAMGEALSIERSRALSCWTCRCPVRPAAPVSVVAAWAQKRTETETKSGDKRQGQKQRQRERGKEKQSHRRGQRQRQGHLLCPAVLVSRLSFLFLRVRLRARGPAHHRSAGRPPRELSQLGWRSPLRRRRLSFGPPPLPAAPPRLCSRALPFASP